MKSAFRYLILLFLHSSLHVPHCCAQLPAARVAKIAHVNGMSMYYEEYGKGKPLLLLHGFTSIGRDAWAPFIEDWSREFRLIVPDLRGHGKSTNPTETFTHRQAAKDIIALMDHLEIGRCRAAGMSSGGNILLHIATKDPNRLSSMILVSAAHYVSDSARKLIGEATLDSLGGIDEWRQQHVQGDAQIEKLLRNFREFGQSKDDMNLTPKDLNRISARTMIVYGDRDKFMPIEIALEQYSSIPNSRLWVLPNSGHVPVIDFSKLPYTRIESIPFATESARFFREQEHPK